MDKIFTKKNVFLTIPIVLFSIVIVLMLSIGVTKCDTYVLNLLQGIRTSNYTLISLIVTNFCSPWVLLAIILIMLIAFKNKKIGLFASLNIVCGLIINQIIKFAVARQRPISYMMIDESGYSFPSAHSMIAMIFYGFLIYILFLTIKKKWLRNMVVVLIALLIPCISFTRIYLGVHYPSDIFCGLLFGYIYLVIYITIIKKYMFKN